MTVFATFASRTAQMFHLCGKWKGSLLKKYGILCKVVVDRSMLNRITFRPLAPLQANHVLLSSHMTLLSRRRYSSDPKIQTVQPTDHSPPEQNHETQPSSGEWGDPRPPWFYTAVNILRAITVPSLSLLFKCFLLLMALLLVAITTYCVFFHDWGDHEHVFSGVSFTVFLVLMCVFTPGRYGDGRQDKGPNFSSFRPQNVRWLNQSRLRTWGIASLRSHLYFESTAPNQPKTCWPRMNTRYLSYPLKRISGCSGSLGRSHRTSNFL
jgi:hypothetical protein